jgi:hypothetical protein
MEAKRLSVKSMATAAAVLWAGAVLFVAVGNILAPDYGEDFLEILSSIYPGYDGDPEAGSAVLVTFYALLDGAVFGAVLAWLYNLSAKHFSKKT